MNINEQIIRGSEITRYWVKNQIPKGFYDGEKASLKWFPSDSEENYNIRGNKKYGIDDISYDINSIGYRSIEFDPKSTSKKIMFLGCSITAGIGLPYEEMWTTLLTKQLADHFDTDIEQHNLGMPGHGADAMAMIAYQSLPIIKPDIVIAMFADISRRMIIYEWETSVAMLAHHYPEDGFFREMHRSYISMSYDPHDFYEWRRNHALIDSTARLCGSSLIWSFTSPCNIKNISPETISTQMNIASYYPDFDFDHHNDLARDGLHPGKNANAAVADKWFKVITQSPRLSRQLRVE